MLVCCLGQDGKHRRGRQQENIYAHLRSRDHDDESEMTSHLDLPPDRELIITKICQSNT